MTDTPNLIAVTETDVLTAVAHALAKATVDGKAQPLPSQRQHAAFVADVWRVLSRSFPTVNGEWFVLEAMPRWVVGTRHEKHWDAAGREAGSRYARRARTELTRLETGQQVERY